MNQIIKAYKAHLKEEHQYRETQLCALKDYCAVKRPLDVQEMILKNVQEEDLLNHPVIHHEIPKLSYPSMVVNRVSGHSFFSKILP